MPLSESANQQAFREFQSPVCPICEAKKQIRQSFCPACYRTLSVDMQRSLWARFGSGYEGNYQEAKDWLLAERKASSKE